MTFAIVDYFFKFMILNAKAVKITQNNDEKQRNKQ